MENHINKITCIGTGLIALDVVVKGNSFEEMPEIYGGGSCGNVLCILGFFGNNTFAIGRLGENLASDLIFKDLRKWGVNLDFIEREEKGKTPIIIHRILESETEDPKHRFEFRNPNTGKWLPSFRPVLAKKVERLVEILPTPEIFYFDRISRSSIELARNARKKGALVFFEPSSDKEKNQFAECIELAHVIKFSGDRIKSFKENHPKSRTILEIETVGKNGLNYRYNSAEWKNIPSFSIENAVDTAGAGDWCSSGIIMKLAELGREKFKSSNEECIAEILKYGQALGAINCRYFGARGLMYHLDKNSLEILVSDLLARKQISDLSIPQSTFLKETINKNDFNTLFQD